MPGAVFGQVRKSLISSSFPETSESEPSLQMKLKEGSPLATWRSEIILLPVHRETKQPAPGLYSVVQGTTCLVGKRHDD